MLCNKRDYSVTEAAKALGVSRSLLERSLRLGNTMFGFYVPSEKPNGQGSYYVYRERVEVYITAQDMRGCPYLNGRADIAT